MAHRGFVAGFVEYPNSAFETVTHTYNGEDPLIALWRDWRQKSAAVFPPAAAALCRQPRADCTAGIALAGHSLGAFLVQLAVGQGLIPGVTAILPLGFGLLDPSFDVVDPA
eukprot:5701442-Prymnesium_polylepis.1